MKKKIKDLTLEESKQICQKYHTRCVECPLNKAGEQCYYYGMSVISGKIDKNVLGREVEVDE